MESTVAQIYTFISIQKALVVHFSEKTYLISAVLEIQIHFTIYIWFENACLRSHVSLCRIQWLLWHWDACSLCGSIGDYLGWLDLGESPLGSARAECWSSLGAQGESAIGYWWTCGGSSFAVLHWGDSSPILLIPSIDLIYYSATMARWTGLCCWAEAFLSCNARPPGQL